MTLKDLREYIDSLDLNEVQSDVELVVNVKGFHNGAGDYGFLDTLADFNLIFPKDKKPYLSLLGESYVEFLDTVKEV